MPVVDTPAAPTELPLWELRSLFPGPGSREFVAAQEALDAAVIRLRALYDARGVRAAATTEDPAVVGEVLAATNEVLAECRTLDAYLYGLVTTDARDDVAGRLRSQLQAQQAILDSLAARLDGWVGRIGAARLVEASPVAADHAYPLIRAEQSARHRMNESEEDLLAELSCHRGQGVGAPARRRDGPSGGHVAPRRRDVRDDARHHGPGQGDRCGRHRPPGGLRRRADGVGGGGRSPRRRPERHQGRGDGRGNRRRGWADPLEPALCANGVDRATLDAMQAAAARQLRRLPRYLRAKAALLGHPAGLPVVGPVRAGRRDGRIRQLAGRHGGR